MKHIQLAPLKKRFLSAFIDLLIISGLFAISYFFIFKIVVSNVQNFSYQEELIKTEKLNSKLFIEKDNKLISLIEEDYSRGENELENVVKNYYIDYLNKKDNKYDLYWYETHVLYLPDFQGKYKDENIVKPKDILFDWDNQELLTYKKKSNYSQEIFDNFYRSSFASATSNIYLFDPIKSAQSTITWGNVRAALYSSFFSTLIPCFIIPISLPNGKTIGKLITKLIVLTDEGYEYKRYKHIFRYLAFYFIEVFGGAVTVGITLILTFSLTVFSKKRRALHDYIAFSVVVDEKHSVFYKDKEEENMYKQKSEEKLLNDIAKN